MLAGLKMLQLLFAEPFRHTGKPSAPVIHELLLIINHHKRQKPKLQQSMDTEQIFLRAAPVICQHIDPAMIGYLQTGALKQPELLLKLLPGIIPCKMVILYTDFFSVLLSPVHLKSGYPCLR